MFDKLVDLIIQFGGLFQFIIQVEPNERAVILRWGRYHRTLSEGPHFIIPFSVEHVLRIEVCLDTVNMNTQSLTTKDGHTVTVSSIIIYRVVDPAKALLTLTDVDRNIADIAHAVVGQSMQKTSWEDVHKEEYTHRVYAQIRRKARRWGVKVEDFQFGDLCRAKPIRLMQE